MKTKIITTTLLAFFFACMLNVISAQNIKVIEVEKEKISDVQEELNALNIDIDIEKIIEEGVEEGSQNIRVIVKDDNGETKEIEWDGEGEMPEEMKAHLENIEIETFDNAKTIKCKSQSKCCSKNGNSSSVRVVTVDSDFEDFERKVQLGVMIENHEKGISVLEVIEGSAAAEAGITDNDIIVELDGQEITDINQFIEMINLNTAGETVEIDLYRGDERIQKTVTLQEADQSNFFIKRIFEDCSSMSAEECKKICKKLSKEECAKLCKGKKSCTKEELKNCKKACDPACCTKASKDISETVLTRNDLSLRKFKSYPNPSDGLINVSFKGDQKPIIVQVMDLTGKSLYKEIINDFDGNYRNSIQLPNDVNGSVILSIIQNEKIKTEKINIIR